ncbi:Sec-independent protein translocase subunit TatA [Actinacidiphila oryziradicis]|uniref:Sec-independent protein translocase protein TatA n=1 Tax=Actinacidiphila oryziradicis TaxID=2571141 RepID=A0A4U0RY62_9ACTN|nr:Sec-independent protein translocase subunit TatA [Actinacidiphila oryziradicis]TKA00618.1 Sec-independent protein translocase subunit TatA [Actinacidiphila oryziradicis]
MLRNGLEPWHLLIVGVVVILMFGSKRLPDAARSLGKSMRILKSETRAMKDDDTATAQSAEATVPAPAEQPAPRTIQAAPGDPTAARPVGEPHPVSATR